MNNEFINENINEDIEYILEIIDQINLARDQIDLLNFDFDSYLLLPNRIWFSEIEQQQIKQAIFNNPIDPSNPRTLQEIKDRCINYFNFCNNNGEQMFDRLIYIIACVYNSTFIERDSSLENLLKEFGYKGFFMSDETIYYKHHPRNISPGFYFCNLLIESINHIKNHPITIKNVKEKMYYILYDTIKDIKYMDSKNISKLILTNWHDSIDIHTIRQDKESFEPVVNKIAEEYNIKMKCDALYESVLKQLGCTIPLY